MHLYRKSYSLIFLMIIGPTSIISMGYAENESSEQVYSNYDDSSTQNQEEQKKEDPPKQSFFEEYFQEADECDKENVTFEHRNNLLLLLHKEEQSATAIFEIPEKSKIYKLTDEEKERIKELFQVNSIENKGNYKVINFNYKSADILPQNQEQAIYFLYSPHIKNNQIEHAFELKKTQLSDLQKKALQLKGLERKTVKIVDKQAAVELKKRVENSNAKRYEGPIGSTKVKTENGYRTLEELKVGDIVACFDIKNSKESYSKVTYIDKLQVPKHIQITIKDQILHVAPKHEFFVQPLGKYITAQELKDNLELRKLVDENITDVKETDESLEVTRLSIDSVHNFYITDHDILVHNYIPLVFEISIAFEIGEGAVATWAIIGPSLTAAATALIYWIFTKSTDDKIPTQTIKTPLNTQQTHEINFQPDIFFKADNNNQSSQNSSQNNQANGAHSPQDPDKDADKKETKLVLDELIRNAKPGKETTGRTKQYEKPGSYEDAIKDFEKLNPSNVKNILSKEGKVGTLNDGRTVNVRKESSCKKPTLEIYNPKNEQSIKFRYGN